VEGVGIGSEDFLLGEDELTEEWSFLFVNVVFTVNVSNH
jgi:hypothetical protein